MVGFTRRRFLQSGIAAGSLLGYQWGSGLPLARAAKAVKSPSLVPYVDPLPLPGAGLVVANTIAPGTYAFTQKEIKVKLHRDLPATPVWAYDDGSGLGAQAGSFGMVVVAQKGTPLTMRFTNGLPYTTYPNWLPVDTRLTNNPANPAQIRLLTHLHGGFLAADSDGNPAAPQRGALPHEPPGFAYNQTQEIKCQNAQAASMLWFHDHGMGTTRLNVFAGLAAAYIIRDQYDTGTEPNPIGIPGGAFEIPLVVQDRMFNADGTFLYPVSDFPGVKWIGEYFGDVMLVNGKVMPFLNVEPRLYRFRILNGCNARILSLDMGGVNFWQIGAESGMFDIPVPLKKIVLAPGERADVIADFRTLAGTTLIVKNQALQKPVVTPAPTLTNVMQIRVGTRVTAQGPLTVPINLLGGQAANLPAPASTPRYFTLNEVNPMTPSWWVNLNAASFMAADTDTLRAGDIEDWVYINLTADTHPMHLHLVKFQIIGRTPFDVKAYMAAATAANMVTPDGVLGGMSPEPYATGPMEPPGQEERGFKDTVKVNPGYFTMIRIQFDLPPNAIGEQRYVHHCHIVEHEDNDMMRPFTVLSKKR